MAIIEAGGVGIVAPLAFALANVGRDMTIIEAAAARRVSCFAEVAQRVRRESGERAPSCAGIRPGLSGPGEAAAHLLIVEGRHHGGKA